ncbi:hypothetical protein Ddye_005523 [Dipteronia dyeriana]|uniref:DUF7705 domain-containing protein n=1 Tax=Dipteronia dyeriana TaxID=168575 RepID=A0AAE0CPQ4_9ROSI|nr:hypothetical protein Ddye_005523 [Dipteronia dyeriana]
MISLTGGFNGTYDLDADISKGIGKNSFFSVSWQKNLSTGSWIFSNTLMISAKYPWLMLYLRSDATKGFNGGYHYNGSGVMSKLPESPNFKVKLTLDVKRDGGSNSQFYLLDIGSCWKNNEMRRLAFLILLIISTAALEMLNIWRNHMICDPYSNPQAQELVQILPHPEWAVHGYPEKKGDGWIGNSRTWELLVGALSNRLYFYQEQLEQDASGPQSMSVQKYMLAGQGRLQNGVQVILMY